MVFYEFRVRDHEGGERLIAVLPERRNDPDRTDLETVMRWQETVLGDSVNPDDLFLVTVALRENEKTSSFEREEFLTVDRSLTSSNLPEE